MCRALQHRSDWMSCRQLLLSTTIDVNIGSIHTKSTWHHYKDDDDDDDDKDDNN
jgi:hypothetical protein